MPTFFFVVKEGIMAVDAKRLAIFVVGLASIAAVADTQTWIGDTDLTWAGANWDTGGLWTDGNTALFGGLGCAITVDSDISAAGMTFASDGYSIGGTAAVGTSGDALTIDVDGVSTATVANVISGTGALVKTGTGTLKLSQADRTFTGGTRVEEGMLVLSGNNAKALGTGTVTVADGATLDFNGALSGAHGAISSVYAEGAGVDGNGALVNTGANHVNKYLSSSGALYLTGDLIFNPSSRFDIGNIYPQGHTFRLKGTGANTTSARVNHYYNPQGGDISIEHGQYLAYEADSFGNTADKSTVYLRGGQISIWRDADSYFSNSPFVIEQAATIQALARYANRNI